MSEPGILMAPLIAGRYKYGDTLRGGMGPICPQTHIQIWKSTIVKKDILRGGPGGYIRPSIQGLPLFNLVSTFSQF